MAFRHTHTTQTHTRHLFLSIRFPFRPLLYIISCTVRELLTHLFSLFLLFSHLKETLHF